MLGSIGMEPWERALPSMASPCCSSSGHGSDFLLTRGRRSREPLGRPRERLAPPPSVLEPLLGPLLLLPFSCTWRA